MDLVNTISLSTRMAAHPVSAASAERSLRHHSLRSPLPASSHHRLTRTITAAITARPRPQPLAAPRPIPQAAATGRMAGTTGRLMFGSSTPSPSHSPTAAGRVVGTAQGAALAAAAGELAAEALGAAAGAGAATQAREPARPTLLAAASAVGREAFSAPATA